MAPPTRQPTDTAQSPTPPPRTPLPTPRHHSCSHSHTRVCVSDCSCLRCFKCDSTLSWEDCNQHTTEVECDVEQDKLCFMAHRILKQAEQQRHLFVKACYWSEMCLAEECRKTELKNVSGSWCETKCCDGEDFCNRGVSSSSSERTVCSLTAALFVTGLHWI